MRRHAVAGTGALFVLLLWLLGAKTPYWVWLVLAVMVTALTYVAGRLAYESGWVDGFNDRRHQ